MLVKDEQEPLGCRQISKPQRLLEAAIADWHQDFRMFALLAPARHALPAIADVLPSHFPAPRCTCPKLLPPRRVSAQTEGKVG